MKNNKMFRKLHKITSGLLTVAMLISCVPTQLFAETSAIQSLPVAGYGTTQMFAYFGNGVGYAQTWNVLSSNSSKVSLWSNSGMGSTAVKFGTTQSSFEAEVLRLEKEVYFSNNDLFTAQDKAVDKSMFVLTKEQIESMDASMRKWQVRNNDYWWYVDSNSYGWWVSGGSGCLSTSGQQSTNEKAIRYAFSLNSSDILFSTASSSTVGKSSVQVGTGFSLGDKTYSGNTYKMTLLDTSINNAQNISVTQKIGYAGNLSEYAESVGQDGILDLVGGLGGPGNLKVSFTNAPTGAKTYMSAILKDSSGNVVDYAKLVDTSSTSSVTDLVVDVSNLTAGSAYTMYLFSEQTNAENQSDYASALSSGFTVCSSSGTVYESVLGSAYKAYGLTANIGEEFKLGFESAVYDTKVNANSTATVTGGSTISQLTLNGTDVTPLTVMGSLTANSVVRNSSSAVVIVDGTLTSNNINVAGYDNTVGASSAEIFGRNNNVTSTGSDNMALGSDLMVLGSGSNSGAIGHNSLVSNSNESYAIGNNNNLTGDNSFIIGNNVNTSGNQQIAIGYKASITTGDGATAIGYNSSAAAANAYAIGTDANASAQNAIALGYGAIASGEDSIAIGHNANATGVGAFSVGNRTNASGAYSTAMGQDTYAIGNTSTAMGQGTNASGCASTAMGYQSYAIGSYSIAAGIQSNASGDYAIALGGNTIASNIASAAIGMGANASGLYSIAIGNYTCASEESATAMGELTNASGCASTAMGYSTNASEAYSTAMGYGTTASGIASGAFGNGSVAAGTSAFALGEGTNASAAASTAMGYQTTAEGDYSTSLGQETVASATASTAMGYGTNAAGNYSVAMGMESNASGDYSTAMGGYTYAIGESSTAMGFQTSASGQYSFAGGYNSSAEGLSSVALGSNASAVAENSFAYGGTVSSAATNGVAIGLGSSVTGANSVALGANSVASSANEVSVGSSTQTRAITNVTSGGVASGTNTNAANMQDLYNATNMTPEGNYYVENAAVTTAVKNIDTALGKTTAGNYIKATDGTATNSVSAQIQALDSGLGAKIASDGNVIKASTTHTINQNISALDTAIGNRSYDNQTTAGGYLTNSETITASLNALNNKSVKSFGIGTSGNATITTVDGTNITSATNIHDYRVTSGAITGSDHKTLTLYTTDKYGTATETINIDVTDIGGTTVEGITTNLSSGKNIVFDTTTAEGKVETKVRLNENVELTSLKAADATGTDTNHTATIAYDGTDGGKAYVKIENTAGGANNYSNMEAEGLTIVEGTNRTTLSATALNIGTVSATTGTTITDTGMTSGSGTSQIKFTTAGISAGSQQITNVASGGTASSSNTNAANMQDLYNATNMTSDGSYYEANDSVTTALGKVDTALGKTQAGNYITATDGTATNSVSAQIQALDSALGEKQSGSYINSSYSVNANLKALDEAITSATGGYTFGDGANTSSVSLGKTIAIKGEDGKNITTTFAKGTDGNATINIALNDDISVTSVTATGAIQGSTVIGTSSVTAGTSENKVTLSDNSVKVGSNTYITGSGLNAGSQQITNVASGGTASESNTNAANMADVYNATAVTVGSTNINTGSGIEFVAGTNVTLTTSGNKITINSTGSGGSDIADYDGTNALVFKDSTGSSASGKITLKNVEIEGLGTSGQKVSETDIEASATGAGAVASGYNSNASGEKSVATGYSAAVSPKSTSGIAIGNGTTVGYSDGGEDTEAENSIGIGYNSSVTGTNSIAIGTGHIVSGNNSGAFGDPNYIAGNSSYAIGNNNNISGENNFVLGNNVTITSGIANSVALGNNSSVTESNTVSVGSKGNERKITNVAAGTNDTDAVNVKQLNDAIAASGGADLTQVKQQLAETGKEIQEVGAMSAALAGLHYVEPTGEGDDKFTGAVAYGGYRGQSAAALGVAYKPNPNLMVSASTSVSNNQNMYNAGVSFKFGKGNTAATRATLQKQVKYLNDKNGELSNRLDNANAKIEEQDTLIQDLIKRLEKLEKKGK